MNRGVTPSQVELSTTSQERYPKTATTDHHRQHLQYLQALPEPHQQTDLPHPAACTIKLSPKQTPRTRSTRSARWARTRLTVESGMRTLRALTSSPQMVHGIAFAVSRRRQSAQIESQLLATRRRIRPLALQLLRDLIPVDNEHAV